MASVLSRVGLRFQVGAIGAAAVVGILAVGGTYAVGQAEVAEYAMTLDSTERLKTVVEKTGAGMLEMRRAEKDFLLRRDGKYVDRHAALTREVAADLTKVGEALGSVPELARLSGSVAGVRKGFESYSEHFSRVVDLERKLGLNEKEGLQGTLRGSVRAVEERLGQFDELRLANLLLMMRRHEKDFMLRQDAKYGEELGKRVEEFSRLLPSAGLSPDVQGEIGGLVGAYRRDFESYMAASVERSKTLKSVSEAYASIEPALDEIQKATAESYAAARAGMSEHQARTGRMLWWMIGLVFLATTVVAWIVGRSVSRPIIGLNGVMSRLADDDLAVEVEGKDRRDEVGSMARAVQVFKESLIAKRAADAAAAADSEARMRRVARRDELTRKFESDISTLSGALISSARGMEVAADSMTTVAQRTDALSVNVAGAAEQTSANVRTVATATEELTISIRDIAVQVAQSAEIASLAVAKAGDTDRTVQELSKGAEKIGEVMALINSIADQTKLLALNATIEAARAGESGKGFAVVASEVKALAGQTTKATQEITAQIASIQGATEGAVEAVREIGKIIGQMSAISNSVAAAVEEQGAVTQEIARSVQEAALGTQQVSGSITDVRSGACETRSSASRVLDAAQELARQSDRLSAEVATFLGGMRAA